MRTKCNDAAGITYPPDGFHRDKDVSPVVLALFSDAELKCLIPPKSLSFVEKSLSLLLGFGSHPQDLYDLIRKNPSRVGESLLLYRIFETSDN